ncbi:MAG: phage late control D family protein [Armatimonadota bacterium]
MTPTTTSRHPAWDTPTLLLEIAGQTASRALMASVLSFSYEDHEDELDTCEIMIADGNRHWIDDPLLQEGHDVRVRFGYAEALSPMHVSVIKEVECDFPEGGVPTIRVKAYDKGCLLAGRQAQRIWQHPSPGVRASDIAETIAREHGLVPVVTPTVDYHLRVAQGNQSDAQFLRGLAKMARDRERAGSTGYAFYIEGDELHFHPRGLQTTPRLVLEYFSDRDGILRSFRPRLQAQAAKGAGVETTAVGVDPRKKTPVEHKANNQTTPARTTLGTRTVLVDGETGERRFTAQESGKVVPSYGAIEHGHSTSIHPTVQREAESQFTPGEHRQIEADAVTIGLPELRAKQNVEVRGVGTKFSGVYYVTSVRHTLGDAGYQCELHLKKNAFGHAAPAHGNSTPTTTQGRPNTQDGQRKPSSPPPAVPPPRMVVIDANTGKRRN